MEQTELVNDHSIPGESLTSGIKQLPYDRPPAMVDNAGIQERLWKTISKPNKIREINALLEIGIPVEELSAQVANGLFREGGITAQNAVMILPSLTVMMTRIAESFGTKYRTGSDDKHAGVSKAEIRAALKKAEGKEGSPKQKADTNNKVMRGFKAVNNSKKELVKNADNVGFLAAAKEKI